MIRVDSSRSEASNAPPPPLRVMGISTRRMVGRAAPFEDPFFPMYASSFFAVPEVAEPAAPSASGGFLGARASQSAYRLRRAASADSIISQTEVEEETHHPDREVHRRAKVKKRYRSPFACQLPRVAVLYRRAPRELKYTMQKIPDVRNRHRRKRKFSRRARRRFHAHTRSAPVMRAHESAYVLSESVLRRNRLPFKQIEPNKLEAFPGARVSVGISDAHMRQVPLRDLALKSALNMKRRILSRENLQFDHSPSPKQGEHDLSDWAKHSDRESSSSENELEKLEAVYSKNPRPRPISGRAAQTITIRSKLLSRRSSLRQHARSRASPPSAEALAAAAVAARRLRLLKGRQKVVVRLPPRRREVRIHASSFQITVLAAIAGIRLKKKLHDRMLGNISRFTESEIRGRANLSPRHRERLLCAFTKIDANGDGVLEFDEVVRFNEIMGKSKYLDARRDAIAFFQAVDTDGDNEISTDEWTAMWEAVVRRDPSGETQLEEFLTEFESIDEFK
eukprot:66436_1